ncbi:putative amidohydrolase [Dysgonomonas hofstadii]|uniref:Omega-amidase YafV n=1 Tax=Dysgonomonas hofstadii TaxID=637886 RepID=A0A840CT34_9BACT|nr:amidohydrolase [Dysgonomonas hofstadii]MBB4037849.1 putative amidohydrolase [Dysgonomonas hofstadii]
MNILLIQTDIKWQDPTYNKNQARKIIDASPDADLIILPEMFTTGFCMTPNGIAEKAATETLQWMQHVAGEKNAAVAGSVATEENGNYYNRFYFVKPDGSYATYNKKHLFTYAGEHNEYTAGEDRVIVEYQGVKILLQICYDLRFPVFSRNKGDYDMIIYVANWPTQRIEPWNILLRARAIENQCYVAAVNRTGNDPDNNYCGGTALIDYLGKTIVSAENNIEEAVSGSIELKSLTRFRESFPALHDADKFTLI